MKSDAPNSPGPATRNQCIIVRSKRNRWAGGKAHRPPSRNKVRPGKRPEGRRSGRLHTNIEGAARTVGGRLTPIDHRPEQKFAAGNVPKRDVVRNVPNLRPPILCLQSSCRIVTRNRTNYHRRAKIRVRGRKRVPPIKDEKGKATLAKTTAMS